MDTYAHYGNMLIMCMVYNYYNYNLLVEEEMGSADVGS